MRAASDLGSHLPDWRPAINPPGLLLKANVVPTVPTVLLVLDPGTVGSLLLMRSSRGSQAQTGTPSLGSGTRYFVPKARGSKMEEGLRGTCGVNPSASLVLVVHFTT